jgi:cellulose synthase/poly-beta-1,6-N-acetylglucosamine synthase-like glycosyltransferase
VTALKLVCLSSLGLVAYCYLVYPLLLAVGARWCGRRHRHDVPLRDPAEWPVVSLIVSAYNEERTIREWVRNALRLDYPADRLEIIVGCDGQEDATGEVARAVADPRVNVLEFSQRRGKPSVLNDCVAIATGVILAFSDANAFYEPEAIKKMVRHYTQQNVGGVVGELELRDPDTGANVDGLYWKYENFLKRREGQIGALLGANGAIYSVRNNLWQPLAAETIVDDFVVGMNVHLAGRQLVFEPEAVAHEESAPSMNAEFQRRTRLGAGAFQSLQWLSPLLNPTRGAVAWAFWSHKVLRWCAPLFLTSGFVTSAMLAAEPLFACLLAAQIAFYAGALVSAVCPIRGPLGRGFRLTTMFCSMNAAIVVGFWRWARGSQSGAWVRTIRSAELPSPAH